MKKHLAMILALALTLSLAACGSGQSSEASVPPSQGSADIFGRVYLPGSNERGLAGHGCRNREHGGRAGDQDF